MFAKVSIETSAMSIVSLALVCIIRHVSTHCASASAILGVSKLGSGCMFTGKPGRQQDMVLGDACATLDLNHHSC